MTAPLTLEQRVARIEDILGIGEGRALAAVPWPLRCSAVLAEAARLWAVTPEELTGETKVRAVILPRAAIAMVLRSDPAMSYSQIGRVLHRDHSSIINLERIALAEFARNPFFCSRVKRLLALADKPEGLAS